MSRRPIEDSEKRILISTRVNPRTLKFLKTIRAKNLGRALDNLVLAHEAFLTAVRNRIPAQQRLQRQPSELNLPR